MRKIVLVSGGSGGHLSPAYALIEELKKRWVSFKAILAISGRPEEERLARYIKNKLTEVRFLSIPILPLKGKDIFNLSIFLSRFIKGSIYSFFFVLLFHPDIIVGFGGILSIPLIIFSFFLRIPTLIHEQNLYPGRANRFLYPFVNKIALSFEESKIFFKHQKKLVVTGNPLRPDFVIMNREDALHKIGLKTGLFTILVLGGSQGAKFINRYFLNMWKKMKGDLEFQVIHLTGLKDFDWVYREYRELGIPFKVFPFYEEMGVLFNAVDLIITRAGASTLNEISFFGKPAIVIPYPYAQKHQYLNALYYAQRGAVILLEEKDLNEETYALIYGIIKNKERQIFLSRKIKELNRPFAREWLANLTEELVGIKYA